ncbi:MAG: DUF362 domain-containing protein [Planctomycetota bacterium]
MTHKPTANRSDSRFTRRDFIGLGIGAAAMTLTPSLLFGDEEDKKNVWVFHGKDKKKLIAACLKIISENGGFGKNAKKLALKVNAAWSRTPEQGANTHPELVDAFLGGVKEFGISDVILPENPCNRGAEAFKRSGIIAVVEKHQFKMIDLQAQKGHYTKTAIPKGKKLVEAMVAKDFLETDVVINMPVAKHHGGTMLSIAMKNWMGAVEDRGFWHKNTIHQCIADFATLLQPRWTIVDATRIMIDHGPQGPTKNMKYPDIVILSKDQVAADAYASTLFLDKPSKVEYIRIAGEMKIGENDIARMNIIKKDVE